MSQRDYIFFYKYIVNNMSILILFSPSTSVEGTYIYSSTSVEGFPYPFFHIVLWFKNPSEILKNTLSMAFFTSIPYFTPSENQKFSFAIWRISVLFTQMVVPLAPIPIPRSRITHTAHIVTVHIVIWHSMFRFIRTDGAMYTFFYLYKAIYFFI